MRNCRVAAKVKQTGRVEQMPSQRIDPCRRVTRLLTRLPDLVSHTLCHRTLHQRGSLRRSADVCENRGASLTSSEFAASAREPA